MVIIHSLLYPACAFLGELNNGTVQYSDNKYAVGSNATFVCNDDFFINGTSDPNITLTCTSGGVWDRPKPSCSSKGKLFSKQTDSIKIKISCV